MEQLNPAERLSVRIKAECVRRGWDLSELARRASISRTTLYHLIEGRTERPHAATLSRLADAFEIPAEALLVDLDARPEPSNAFPLNDADARRRLDRSTNPQIDSIARERPGLFAAWTNEDWDELYSTFGAGGALSRQGVVVAAESINRKRETIRRLHIVLETHLRVVAEELVDTLYRMVRPQGLTPTVSSVLPFAVPAATESFPPSEESDPSPPDQPV